MKNFHARRLRRLIRYGAYSRCANCRGRQFSVHARTSSVRCEACQTEQSVLSFIDREIEARRRTFHGSPRLGSLRASLTERITT